jgi:hypothetical protein
MFRRECPVSVDVAFCKLLASPWFSLNPWNDLIDVV